MTARNWLGAILVFGPPIAILGLLMADAIGTMGLMWTLKVFGSAILLIASAVLMAVGWALFMEGKR